jgi:hypothetical protein
LDEVNLVTLSEYYQQCTAGLIFLDPNHQSHNIPGKFISYLEATLPVVACVNSNNDLVQLIHSHKLGMASHDLSEVSHELLAFIRGIDEDMAIRARARDFYEAHYQPISIAEQILKS